MLLKKRRQDVLMVNQVFAKIFLARRCRLGLHRRRSGRSGPHQGTPGGGHHEKNTQAGPKNGPLQNKMAYKMHR
jgi:hypothetical protein